MPETKNEAPAPDRRAKIVCTLGPASESEAVIRDLIRAGMDVARLNFSHGTHEEHARTIDRVRRVADQERKHVAILQDLQGPKIRTGRLKHGTPVSLRTGGKLTITPRDVAGSAALISTTFPGLAREVSPGERILLADGLIELRVRAISGNNVECDIVNGGMLGEQKGINLPGVALSIPSLTDKDRDDLQFGLKRDLDMVALSFVRTADDVREIKRLIGERHVSVIAKLEKPQAIDHLEEILEEADGVMVARGDLGVEMPPEQVPVLQKQIIRRACHWRKPVITATQMLESMIENPRPTRAEASDVANAVFDGTDAVMLSAETAAGKYPREAVAMMARIVVEAERNMVINCNTQMVQPSRLSIAETICESIAHAAQELDMRAIAVFTETGTTARLISKYRPKAPVWAFAPDPAVCRRMSLLWGVHPVMWRTYGQTERMVQFVEEELLERGAVHPGDTIGVVTGTRMIAGYTNLMRLQVVAERSKSTERRRAPH